MYELIANQVAGINGLINLSNVVFLVAFSVRDVLKLRILAIVGEGLTLPYYYFQDEKLWPPIFWGAAFMIVNAIRVVAIALERRPVVLSDKEQQLYRVAFSSMGRLLAWGGYSQEGPADIRGYCRHIWGPRSYSRRKLQTGDSTRSAHRRRERLQWSSQSSGRSGLRTRDSRKVGPAARERVYGKQTRTSC
jgi:hypothetical protein